MMRLRNGVIAGSSPTRLGIPLWQHRESAAKEVHVAAGNPFYAMFVGSDPTGGGLAMEQCGVPFSFVFNENVDYEVAFNRAQCVHSRRTQACAAVPGR